MIISQEKNIPFESIGDRVKSVRKSKNLTQQVFAKRLDTSSGFISEVENGVKMPGYDLLLSLKREFPDTDMNWLVSIMEMLDDKGKAEALKAIKKEKLFVDYHTPRKPRPSGGDDGK